MAIKRGMAACQSAEDCNSHGDCEDKHCVCDFAWFGPTCSTSGNLNWGVLWTFCVISASALYFILMLWAGYKLAKQLRAHRVIGCKRLLRRTLTTPKYQALAALCLVGLLRGLWWSLDPHQFQSFTSRLEDQMLFLSPAPLLFLLFSLVILVWNGICRGLKLGGRVSSLCTRLFVYAEIVAAFPLLLGFAGVQGYRLVSRTFNWAVFAICLFGVTTLTVTIIFYVVLINRYVKAALVTVEEQDSAPEETNRGRKNHQETPSFTLRPGEGVDTGEMCTELESESFKPEVGQCWSTFQSPTGLKPVLFVPNSSRSCQNAKSPKLTLSLKSEDQATLRQILILSVLSSSAGVAALTLTLLANSLSLGSVLSLLATILCSLLELFSAYSLLFLFTTEIHVQSKANLHFFLELSLRFAAVQPQLSLPSALPHISTRLQRYLGVL